MPKMSRELFKALYTFLSYLIFLKTLWDSLYYHPYYADKESEVQNACSTLP